MLAKIKPVTSSFSFGTADTIQLVSTSDDLATTATFSYSLGKTFQQSQAKGTSDPAPIVFIPDTTSSGSVVLGGSDYTDWDGSNSEVLALVVPKISGITLA